jgi:hypothetical protein
MRVQVSYVRSVGASTEADLTGRVLPPVDGLLQEEPRVGHPLIVWMGNRRILRTSPVTSVEAGGGRTWEITTRRSVYRVRRADHLTP